MRWQQRLPLVQHPATAPVHGVPLVRLRALRAVATAAFGKPVVSELLPAHSLPTATAAQPTSVPTSTTLTATLITATASHAAAHTVAIGLPTRRVPKHNGSYRVGRTQR